MNPVFFNPVLILLLPVSGISKSQQEKICFSLIQPQLLPCTPACGYKFHALAVYLHPTLTAHTIRGAFGIQSNIFGGAFSIVNVLRLFDYFRRRVPSWMFGRILNATLPTNSLHLHQKLAKFPGMFEDIPRNV